MELKQDWGYDAHAMDELRAMEASLSGRCGRSESISFFPKVVRRLKRIALAVVVVPLVILPYLAAVLAFLGMGGKRPGPGREGLEQGLAGLMPVWRHMPMHLATKLEEAHLFRVADIASPSMEIGCGTMQHSCMVNEGRTVDWAFDMSPGMMVGFRNTGRKVFADIISADTYCMPFPEDSFATVLSVNAIDDFQRGADGAVAEYARILHAGGNLVLSGFSARFRDASPFMKLAPGGGLFDFFDGGIHTLFDEPQWRTVLENHGFRLVEFRYLLPMSAVRQAVWDFALALERILVNRLHFRHAFTPLLAFSGFRRWFVARVLDGLPLSGDGQGRRGPLFFLVAERRKGEAVEAGRATPVCLRCGGELRAAGPVAEGGPGFDLFGNGAVDPRDVGLLRCAGCGTSYPVVHGVAVVHPELYSPPEGGWTCGRPQ